MGSAKNIVVLIFIILTHTCVLAQKPTVTSVSKVSGSFSSTVTIKGNDFGTDASKIKVFFGPVVGTIKTISNKLIEVLIPAGTSYDNITVLNTANGLAGYSNSQFLLSYSGAQGLTASNFAAEFQKQSDLGLYDLALGDFNGDNLTDVACASDKQNALSIMYNGSTPSTINFTKSNANLLSNIKTFHITAGDLNGDGKLDIVASEAEGTGSLQDRIVIYKNVGSFNWSIQSIKLAGRKVKRVAIADLDLDGKPEIVVTDKASNIISILPNVSTTNTILFGSPVNLIIPQAKSTDALEIKDMNGDGSPEIITSQFNEQNSNIFICSNKSTPGNFNLADIITLVLNSSVVGIRVGDLDGDKKPDIVATRLLGTDIAILRNTSTATQYGFEDPKLLRTSIRPWGLDLGDLDGDGKIDIVVSSIDPTQGKTISILNNKSTAGNLAFADLLTLPTQFINRHLKIGDVDGDAKPDIIFASVDDNSLGVPSSKISVFRNKSCLLPQVTPTGPLTICSGYPLTLEASSSPGTQYAWSSGSSTTAQQSVTTSGNYSVTATSEAGACVLSSNAVNVTVSTASATLTASPTPGNDGPVCTGSALQLTMNDVGATQYRWSGPNAYAANITTPNPPALLNFAIDNAGIYSVDLIKGGLLGSGGCLAQTATTIVEAIEIPTFTVIYSGGDVLCQNTSKVLGLSPVVGSGFTFQWFDGATALSGKNDATLSVTKSGDYSAQIKSVQGSCAASNTAVSKITVLTIPVSKFSVSPTPSCSGTELTFSSSQSVVDPKAPTPTYAWTFGDNTTSNLPSPKHTYTAGQTYDVFFTIDYTGITGCTVQTKVPINVLSVVIPVISSTSAGICDGESKTLKIDGAFNTITWLDNTKGSTLTITKPGTYSATTVDTNGCLGSAQVVVALKPSPTVKINADKTSVPPGQSVQLTASGADTYLWAPAETLDNAAIASPKASPTVNTTYTVKGTAGGCAGQDSIDIIVSGDLLTIKVTNIFTPNGDGHNDVWAIPGIDYYQDCTLSLFDKNGSKVFEQKGYKSDWDGTYKGQNAPEGTYYYVLVCPDKKPLTGNVLLAR